MTTSSIHYIKKGVLRPSIYDQFLDGNGNPIDLTTATTVKFSMQSYHNLGGSNKIDAASATVDNAPQGKVHYDFTGSDTDTADKYRAEWKVTWGDGSTEILPAKTYKDVQVIASLPL